MKLSNVIGFDYRTGQYVVGEKDLKGNKVEASQYGVADVDAFLAQYTHGGESAQMDHALLGAAIVEPIEQVVPYQEIYGPVFFQDQPDGELEDNSIPVEDTVSLAWETHQDGAVHFVRSGFSWTRPDFTTYDTGIEVPWAMLKKAGWNFLARQMRRATEDLARKRDALSKGVLDAAILASHGYNVAGGALTKASVDAVLGDQASIGFPVQRVTVNPGTLMDMATFTWGGTGFFIPPEEARQLLRTLHIMNYGGAEWYTNPFHPTNVLYFGGAPDQIGWHQTRGEVTNASDVDIRNKVDLHAVLDQEHAYYIGNAYTLSKLTIGA